MNNLFERKGIHMPEYYPKEILGWRIDISSTKKWRQFFRKLHIEPPYFVGDKIELTFKYTKISNDYQQLGGRIVLLAYDPHNEGLIPPYRRIEIPALKKDIVKIPYISQTQLSKDGISVIYLVARDSVGKSSVDGERFPLFSTGVKHKDFVRWDIFLILIGILGGGILGCIAGVIGPLILSHYFGIGK